MDPLIDSNLTLCSPRPSSGLGTNKPVIASSSLPEHCPSNFVLIKVERFGFSANNITYQALGEHPHFRYFDFHASPLTTDVSSESHGVIPVWGFGTVVKSGHPKVELGEKVYGYSAPARYILVEVSPSDINKFAFYVPRAHLPADRRPYNQILRCATDTHYNPSPLGEDLTMLYRPLFWTSFWCEDWLHTSGYRGVSTILISSASSKTAFCLAYVIGKRIRKGELSKDVKIIGLTSKRNTEFTKGLGLYHEVVDYDTFTSFRSFQGEKDSRWLYIDVAGNEDLNKKIFSHFASPYTGKLVACISLGLTSLSPSSSNASSINWSTNTSPSPSSSGSETSSSTSPFWPQVEQFFMPEWLDVRKFQLSIKEIFRQQQEAWNELMTDCIGWVQLERVYGVDGVLQAYERLAKEGLGPDKGQIWSLWDEDNRPKLFSRL
ncbi:hypothetical protein BDQ12DRAFT_656785 [Crucibulum laeve]|uniref:DUF2855 family protein n=1 Tax=Crucibulum laeve TaxID=68775 RepID=A0A5C3LMM9_9AGAR|nr:hypothetical protein BDQ12DRAFT_656785 [Crucibulum laeve]